MSDLEGGPSLATRAVHGATMHDPSGAIAPPIHLSTTFERAADGTYPGGYEYARESNPNRALFERALADLEGGSEAAAFASGMAATMTLFQALRPGDHVVVADDCYWGVRVMLDEVFAPWGLAITFAACSDLPALEGVLRPATRLVFVETPSNPMLRITDLAAAAALAHGAGALLVCDNTLPTPVLQRPFEHGADLVVHSTTKYLSGNHDAMGGAVVAKRPGDFWTRMRRLQKTCGSIPSPFASWLSLRGISSLVPRVRWHDAGALAVAEFLARDPRVLEVLHPGLPAHPQHALAARQSSGIGGLFSFRVRGGRDAALRVAAAVQLFRRATSFGGPESLIEHRASIEGPDTKTPDDLLRLAIGLEDPADLIADLDRALSQSLSASSP